MPADRLADRARPGRGAVVPARRRSPSPAIQRHAPAARREGRLLPRHALRLVGRRSLSLNWSGHEYFGQWFEKYDPKIHDAITGPVEEFLTDDAGLGYAEAKPGEVVRADRRRRRPQAGGAAYRRFETYEIVDHGKWSAKTSPDRDRVHPRARGTPTATATSIARRSGSSGDTLVLEHRLENTGRKTIATSVYDHNFFTLDGQTTGPDAAVTFPRSSRRRPGRSTAWPRRAAARSVS